MKEDYLWDKKGSDPEIEKLENVLRTFRHKEQEALLLATQTIAFDNRSKPGNAPRRLFSFGFASVACLAVAIFGVALLQMMRSGDSEVAKKESVNKIENLTTNTDAENHATSTQPTTTNFENIETRVRNSGSEHERITSARKLINRVSRTRKSPKIFAKVNSSRETEDHEVVLTKEEKYAYDQLMLGLSITSSNLKIVRDKANGIREIAMPKKVGS